MLKKGVCNGEKLRTTTRTALFGGRHPLARGVVGNNPTGCFRRAARVHVEMRLGYPARLQTRDKSRHEGKREKAALAWQCCPQNRDNAPLTHSERINYPVFVILPIIGARECNFRKAARRAAPQNQGFERDIYVFT
jgi:hypothetical protein